MHPGSRHSEEDARRIVFGAFVFDATRRELRCGGRPITLSGQPFDLLELLLEQAGSLVTRQHIRERLWPDQRIVDFQQGINACVREIRQALGDDAGQPRFIKTVPRHGYTFIAPVSRVPAAANHATSRLRVAALILVFSVVIAAAALMRPANQDSPGVPPQDALDAYVRGEHVLDNKHEADLDEAVREFEFALAIAPRYAAAWTGLADAHFYRQAMPSEALPAALTAVTRALELEPESPRALVRFADLQFVWKWDFDAAERAYRAALALAPGGAESHHSYAAFLMASGRFNEAFDAMSRALAIDPLSVVMHGDLAWFYSMAGRHDDALAQCRLLRDIGPENGRVLSCPMRSLLQSGRLDEAARVAREIITAVDASARLSADLSTAATIDAYWRWRLARLEAAAERRYVDPMAFAIVHARLKSPLEALDWLESAVNDRSRLAPYTRLYPEFVALRGTERFDALATPGPAVLAHKNDRSRRHR